MNERNPDPDRPSEISAISRLDADLRHVTTYADVYMAAEKYLQREFGLSDEEVTGYLKYAHKHISGAHTIVDDGRWAEEQYRYGIFRMTLELADLLHSSRDDYTDCIEAITYMASNITGSQHSSERCLREKGTRGLQCEQEAICPIKHMKAILIHDAINPDFTSGEYEGPFARMKFERTTIRLIVAERLKLTVGSEASALRANYLSRCKAHDLTFFLSEQPEPEDI